MKPVVLALAVALVGTPESSQAPGNTKPSFEVVSVKPNASGDSYMDGTPGGRFIATGIPLMMLITEAYNVRGFQVIGGPGWIKTDKWDIEGRPAADAAASTNPNTGGSGYPMLQSLLEDRFQLKVRREVRDLPVYELAVAGGGPKFKTSLGVPAGRPRMRMGRGSLEAYEAPMAGIIRVLSNQLDRALIDKTGLTGAYDINLKWTPDSLLAAPGNTAPAPDQPSIFTALQEQLGLRLESAKAPVEVLVIEGVQKPAAN